MLEKVQQEYLKGLYLALSKDCVRQIPSLRVQELERDVSRLFSCVEQRGFRVLTEDLPDIGKHFDLCLSSGRLVKRDGVLSRTVTKTSPIPRLFKGLVLRVFNTHGNLRTTPCTQSIRFLRQYYYLAKKWRMKCHDSRTFNEVREFYRVDQQLRYPTLNWDSDSLLDGTKSAYHNTFVDRPSLSSSFHGGGDLFTKGSPPLRSVDTGRLLYLLQGVSDLMSATLGGFSASDWLPQHGPGVVSDPVRGSSKYEFPHWPDRLESVFPASEFAFANPGVWSDSLAMGELEARFASGLHPSKLIAVPKTQKGPRLIAAEPTCNLWCQQAIRKFLVDRTRSSWIGRMISFNDQTPNQRLALVASLSGDKATIDLKAASDRLSCWVVERIFRSNFSLLEALHATRTTIIRNLIDKKSPEFYELRKFSTMGSAVTFPIQSLVFAACALASYMYEENTRSLHRAKQLAKEVRVFGDDIIVPTHVLGTLRHLLETLGFEVNDTKTFGTGKFRESCGVDAYDGVDVTPAYALSMPTKSKSESVMSSAAQAHNFASRGLWHAAEYHEWSAHKVGLGKDLPYVTPGSDVLGWPSPLGNDVSHLKVRWNTALQRFEYRTRVIKTRSARLADRGASRLLQYFVEAPSPLIKWVGGYDVRSVVMSRPRWVPLIFRLPLTEQ